MGRFPVSQKRVVLPGWDAKAFARCGKSQLSDCIVAWQNPNMPCEECDRLWRSFQIASIDHVKMGKILEASVNGLDAFKKASAASELAGIVRDEARRELTAHQKATGHY
jgi:hypothetical protein